MLISEAKAYVGHFIRYTFSDRKGDLHTKEGELFDVTFVPLYGPCIITDDGDIRLDRVVSIEFQQQRRLDVA